MKRFDILEHTADVGIVAYGKSLKEVFENTALGMFSLIVDPRTVRERVCYDVRVENEEKEDLLVEWLNELLYIFEVNKVVFKKLKALRLKDERFLEAKACGERIDLRRHQFEIQIKGCTYHELRVEKDKTWRAQVIFDV
ncbi:MAG TPA: archease [Actinobacteria bacterium]|nr:archease [Actinomycetota bacterium]